MKKSGTQIPSLRPLSTLRPCRIREGIRSSVTTAWPSAVGAGEHDGEHERLDQGDAWQNRHPDEGAGGDGEWQSDAEQPRRESELAP
jgi:hypothetical protein